MSTRKPKKPFQDPMMEREKQKYEFPVPSREAILALLAEHNEPLPFQTLAAELGVKDERDEDAFLRRLRAMERDGQILKNRRDLYGIARKMDMVCGRVTGHPDGFVPIPEEEGETCFFLHANATGDARTAMARHRRTSATARGRDSRSARARTNHRRPA
jgi:ribonuclease R